jgi:hypothetical protein
LQCDGFAVVGALVYVVAGSECRGNSLRWWWRFEVAASVSFAVAVVLWGWVVALLGFGWRLGCCVGSKVVDPTSWLAGGQLAMWGFRVEACEATKIAMAKVWLRQDRVSRLHPGVSECLRADLPLCEVEAALGQCTMT